MSKPSSRKQREEIRPTPERTHRDRGIYIGLIIIGASIVGFAFLVFEGRWKETAIMYGMAMIALVNFYTFRAFQGSKMASWKQSLARLPLRCVGYGTKDGKPIEAAHGSESAKKMLIVTTVVSVVLLAGLTWLLVPHVQRWLEV